MANNQEQKQEQSPTPVITFFVTGFGPFCGVSSNPTSTLVNNLKDHFHKTDTKAIRDDGVYDCRTTSPTLENTEINFTVIETSASAARKELDGIYSKIRDEILLIPVDESVSSVATSKQSHDDYAVVIHFGVDSGSKNIALEQCAYNEADFRVPDERGFCPKNSCILETGDKVLGFCMKTDLNLSDILVNLREKEEKITISHNPGRFVCNYTYFYSLFKCDEIRSSSSTTEGMVSTLFVHVPSFDVIGEEDQLEFALNLMRVLRQHILSPSNVESKEDSGWVSLKHFANNIMSMMRGYVMQFVRLIRFNLISATSFEHTVGGWKNWFLRR